MRGTFLPLSAALGTVQAGRKAAALAALHAAGLPVPASIVIPAEVPGSALPAVTAQILSWAAGIAPAGLIARSSALAEDGERASFAGVFTSLFTPLDPVPVGEALHAVRASAGAPAARAYARAHGLDPGTAMPVLVQPALRPCAAGVLAAELDDGQCARWRIEAVHGLAEPLVNGTATGETHHGCGSGAASPVPARQRYLVLPGTSQELRTLPGEWITLPRRRGSPEPAKIAFSGGGLLRLYCPPAWAATPILSDQERTALLRLAVRASAVLNLNRIDLEWALQPTGEIFVLQARPLTTPLPGPPGPGQPAAGGGWHGIPAAPGTATGEVARLGHAEITPHAIVICPALTADTVSVLIARPAAIVAATGGTLSHTAIVARELGIPCVTNVSDAMTAIPPGLHVIVNGTDGTIRPLPVPPGPAPQPGPVSKPAEKPTASISCRLPGTPGTGPSGHSAIIIDAAGPCTSSAVLAYLATAPPGTGVLLADPRSQAPAQAAGRRQHELDHLVRVIWPADGGFPPPVIAARDPAGRILWQRPRRPAASQSPVPDILPADLAGFARNMLGACALTASRSWPYHGGEVYELAHPDGCRYILKRHPSDRHFRRENEGLGWALGLGPGHAPSLLAADHTLRAVILTMLPGIPLSEANLSPAGERQAYRQAGQLLSILHSSIPPAPDSRVLDRLAGNAGDLLRQVGDELTAQQRTRLREQASYLQAQARQLPAVPTHGDFQSRNLLWDPATRQLAVIDFEKAAPAPAVRDLILLEAGPLHDRHDLRDAFYQGFGRALSLIERAALTALLHLDALADLAWGISNGDTYMAAAARRVIAVPGPSLIEAASHPAGGDQPAGQGW
jgi:pyruvate,water dikinase